ncbi:hypothetical protein HDU80_005052 [Chytriomyces hyalinus]|nr:hypothetical protein HDU80_005052 [Chytriomyces hyalinus]
MASGFTSLKAPGRGPPHCDSNIYMKNLAPTTTSDSLKNAFSQFGATRAAVNGRGFGFVDVPEDKVESVIMVMNGKVLEGNSIIVLKSQETISPVDSGATKHIVKSRDMLSNHRMAEPTSFMTASQNIITGSGVTGEACSGHLQIKNAEEVPDHPDNLLSVWEFLQDSYNVWFNHADNTVNIGKLLKKGSKILAQAKGENGQYKLDIIPNHLVLLGSGLPSKKDIALWHSQFHHANIQDISRIATASK